MRIAQLGKCGTKLPKNAGEAVLEWDHRVSEPRREGRTIFLPAHGPVEFYPLQDGRQFLVVVWDKTRNSYNSEPQWTHTLHFGGTDEQPFLVQMEPAVLDELTGGEEAFYQTLKPPTAISMEEYENGTAIGSTRHRVHLGWLATVSQLVLAEGTLKAPDHNDLELAGPHILMQTAHLSKPQQAD
ncbi:MAG: hypothetical protein HYW33_00070 [Candidatus Blackburnbacteria bacterium]|nr:hypothetical protein [Candidatus Blackburnbacteria bacterium]